MSIAMTEKQKREIMRKGTIASTKIIEKLEIRIEELEKENKELKEYWSIEINTCNRYREKCTELEKENKELKAQIAEYDDLTEELDYFSITLFILVMI